MYNTTVLIQYRRDDIKQRQGQHYQNAHQPEKHWHRFSRAVACSISFSTCILTLKAISGLKSRPRMNREGKARVVAEDHEPVILFCTRLYTKSALSLRTSWPPGWPSSIEKCISRLTYPVKARITIENVIFVCLEFAHRPLRIAGCSGIFRSPLWVHVIVCICFRILKE